MEAFISEHAKNPVPGFANSAKFLLSSQQELGDKNDTVF